VAYDRDVIAEAALDRRLTRRLRCATVAAGLIAVSACGGDSADADDEISGIGEAYVAVLSTVLPDSTVADDEPLPVLYLWEFTEEPMSLDDQVVVIDHFDDTHDVRFVDQFEAAVDLDAPAEPPRDEGLLIGLGPIPVEPPHDVRVEIYESANAISAVLVTLVTRDDTWTVTDEAPVVPEAFDAVT
jgi:hypothetical protein